MKLVVLIKQLNKLATEIARSTDVTNDQKQSLVGLVDLLDIEFARVENRLANLLERIGTTDN